MRNMLLKERLKSVRSGGQSGVDRAALKAAVKLEIKYTGYCPKGGWAEDMTEPPGIRKDYPDLTETETNGTEERTVKNVLESDATLVLFPGKSPGTGLTIMTAEKAGKPYFTFNEETDVDGLISWLFSLPEGTDLNIAGPRESESPGVFEKSTAVLEKVMNIKK